jgi:hypothetical protein
VLVAPRYLMRCRGKNPRRVESVDNVSFSATRDDGQSDSGETLEQGEVHERIRRQPHSCRRPESAEIPRRSTPRGVKTMGGSSNQ